MACHQRPFFVFQREKSICRQALLFQKRKPKIIPSNIVTKVHISFKRDPIILIRLFRDVMMSQTCHTVIVSSTLLKNEDGAGLVRNTKLQFPYHH